MTERLDLTASRNETWRPTIDLPYSGAALPLAGATISLQWRLYEGATGAPLLDCGSVPFTDQLESDEDIASGVAKPGDRVLRLSPVASKAAINALPSGLNQPEPGEADRYVWDAIITYADGAIDRPVAGFVYLGKGTTVNGG
ncbi:hypothetical protein [Sphingobium sp. WCS2017Hpa-17]|uniref:hypothetical protein n=1 Tax=Sphingobium sp. WCS2017Hpa-17 TaxID=3073638 RepID=UPI00288C5D45|nr:hypothetical protein [Sphingobium sp. WCS2017Hpa-17]